MKNSDHADAKALPSLVRAARADVTKLRNAILRELSTRSYRDSPVSTAHVLRLVREYGAALLKLTSLEDQVDQYSDSIRGIAQGNAVDLDNARREVLDRIARFRERRGG